MNINFKDLVNVIVILILSLLFAFFANPQFAIIENTPFFILVMFSIYFIHWIVFLPSYIAQTEKFFDITGTVAYLFSLLLTIYFLTITQNIIHVRSLTILILIFVWSIRLGYFLFSRITRDKVDKRFTNLKKSFSKFFVTWTVSGMWVFITLLNGLTVIINNVSYFNDLFYVIGLATWIIGFSIEVISDEQKKRFKRNVENKNKFISTGLWKFSRHPNYFGEMLIWIGISIISFPTLTGFQYLTLISPFFVIWLLINISGINLLEEKADLKWGSVNSYIKYKKHTPVLIPFSKTFRS